MGIRKKTNKSPPVFSHEFIIQNHADIVSCVAMVFLLGLMFEVTAKVAVFFVTVQYNVTITTNEGPDETSINFFHHGLKDLATVFFYMLVAIIMHAIIQEYVLDERFLSNPASLWEGYPHTLMLFQMKFFYICQMGYWLHALPELYFQKTKKEDILRRLVYISLYLVQIGGAYLLNFTVWAILFVLGRLLTLSLSVLTVGFGLAGSEQGLDFASGNFNVLIVRITVLAVICVTQAFMMWKFINFQLRRWREHAQAQSLKKKPVPTKSKSSKKENKGWS
ncbi:UNVERIFIED_CONTAM: hypothetical protein FKN15_072409 [Acipenser sinensis]